MKYNTVPIFRRPKPLSVFNQCRACGKEIVGRECVQRIVCGEERVYVSPDVYGYRTYPSGASLACGSYRKDGFSAAHSMGFNFDDAHGERFVRCDCSEFHQEFTTMSIIREHYRDALREKFGNRLTVPLLFSLPSDVVAWENSACVFVAHTDAGFEITSEGLSLLDLLRDMSRSGVFDGATSKITMDQALNGYTYLRLFKPKFRVFVAADFGASATVQELFSKVPTEWIDWKALPMLKCVEDSDHGLVLSPLVGLPLVPSLFQFLKLQKGNIDYPVVHGSNVTSKGTWVQFMPGDFRASDAFDDRYQHVYLGTGPSFLPSGEVVIQTDETVLTFEPGVTLVSASGARLSGGKFPLSVFVNGKVAFSLHTAECDLRSVHCKCCAVPTMQRSYSIAVQCESYVVGTALGSWYRDVFDVKSTEARFFSKYAEMVLLGYDSVARRLPRVRSRGVARQTGDGGVSVVAREALNTSDGVVWDPKGAAVLRDPVMEGPEKQLRVGGVTLAGRTLLGVRGAVVLHVDSVDAGSDTAAISWDCSVPVSVASASAFGASQLRFDEVSVADSCVIDDGGPSDGEFEDETATFIFGGLARPLDLLQYKMPSSHRIPGKGVSYLKLVMDEESVIHRLGLSPSLRELLTLPMRFVDRDVLMSTGLAFEKSCCHVVELSRCELTWGQTYLYVRSWGDLHYGDSFLALLEELFGKSYAVDFPVRTMICV